jgi:ATP-dependent DNA helicase PIF1
MLVCSPDLSQEQNYAFERFKQGKNLFITGPGGTGKTRLIHTLTRHCENAGLAYQVCALTGCAAILLGTSARTLHSWSGIKLAKGDRSKIISSALKSRKGRASWKKTKILIVDEVSMMSLKIFEIIEEIARTARLSSLPFGGMQVIFTGDFYQLPPIGTPGEPDTEQFCFESAIWSKVFSLENHIQLRTIFRQADPKYKEILLQIRDGTLTKENADLLQGHVKRTFNSEEHNGCIPTKLFPTRVKTDFLNQSQYNKLEGPEYTYIYDKKTTCKTYLETGKAIPAGLLEACSGLTLQETEYEIQSLVSNSNFQESLSLKKGTAVMCTKNLDMDQGICNGSQGVIVDFVEGPAKTKYPLVKFVNGITKLIQLQYHQSDEYPCIAVGQVPLCMAWALTIHKIQGATLKMADIDVGMNVFEYGQTYVALSRVASLEGLYLTAFNPGRIRVHEKVKTFYRKIPEIAEISAESVVLDFEKYENKEETPDPTVKKIKL